MYTKPEFAAPSSTDIAQVIAEAPFATLVTHGPDGLVATHLIMLFEPDRGPNGTLVSHLALANPHAALVAEGRETLAIFSGPHGYISSSWYPAEPVRDSAPTWNYAAVHCRGRPVPLDDRGTARHLLTLVERMEQGRPERWRMRELGPGGMERRLPHILGFDLPIERLDAKFKMGQDERLRDTRGAITALEASDPPLAAMMARHNAGRETD
ncbi:FMN-binding negative transcriptional regulator [Ancylobacter sp. FA202]|uniref:FMN-binding negative transcriptional regulator n=1 Tax=Ancylobacter sp. FA202 TaxID=1111106 RepID=UPI0003758B0B|nr:FMN-binding negative transcriptional regulator [Ancylobacter sp. FA202]